MKSAPARTSTTISATLAAGLFAGALGGWALFALSLWSNGQDLRALSLSDSLAFWIALRSAALFPLLGSGLGALLGGLLFPLLGHRRQGWQWIFALVVGIFTAAIAFAELTASGQLLDLAGLPLGDPARLTTALRHGLTALALGGILAGVSWWAGGWRLFTGRQRTTPPRPLFRAALFCGILTLLWGVSSAALVRSRPLPAHPERVVVVGLDGMTFRVLSPLLRGGELPTFKRLVEEGAWGTFMTYGTASSPQVWTTLATGHRVRDHGIHDFVHAERGSYRAQPMKSFDRKTRALWGLLGETDHRVAVVNWLMTFPPEEVNGFMVPRLNTRRSLMTYPPQMAEELQQHLTPLDEAPNSLTVQHFKRQIDRTFDAAEHLLAREPLDFLAFMNASCDAAQHRLWKFYQPSAFSSELWDLDNWTADEIRRRGQVIPTVYRHLDHRLGRLLDGLDEQTLLIVLSDHGQGPAPRPRVHLRLDRLLADLGWAQLADNPKGRQTLDLEHSRAYPLVETPWTPVMRVNLNLKGREPQGIVAPREADALRHLLAKELAAIHFEHGAPLFGEIKVRAPDARGGVDLRLPLAPGVRDPRQTDRPLLLGQRRLPLRHYLEIDTSISGEHHPQGVIFLRGPGVRTGHIGQQVLTTSLHELIWHLTDKVDAIDSLLPPLRRLGLLDAATTLDLTPTVLHAFGLPVARDMEGRPLLEAYSAPQAVRWIETWEQGEQAGEAPEGDDPEEDEEVLERLRSLGYVN